jgi:hypothetical protein
MSAFTEMDIADNRFFSGETHRQLFFASRRSRRAISIKKSPGISRRRCMPSPNWPRYLASTKYCQR